MAYQGSVSGLLVPVKIYQWPVRACQWPVRGLSGPVSGLSGPGSGLSVACQVVLLTVARFSGPFGLSGSVSGLSGLGFQGHLASQGLSVDCQGLEVACQWLVR